MDCTLISWGDKTIKAKTLSFIFQIFLKQIHSLEEIRTIQPQVSNRGKDLWLKSLRHFDVLDWTSSPCARARACWRQRTAPPFVRGTISGRHRRLVSTSASSSWFRLHVVKKLWKRSIYNAVTLENCFIFLDREHHHDEQNTWIENGRAVFPTDKFEVISPDQFKYNPVGALIRDPLLLVLFQLVVNEAWRQASRRKPRAKFGRIVLKRQEIES